MPDNNLLKVLGKPDNKSANNLKDVLGEPDVKKNGTSLETGVNQNLPSESVGQESSSKSQSSNGFRTVGSPTQKPKVQIEQGEARTLYEEPIIKEGQPISIPPKPKSKQQLLEERVEQKTKDRWNKNLQPGTSFPTPDEKINNISAFKNDLDNKYKDLLINATDQPTKDQLIKDYQKELDNAATKFGLDKKNERYYVPQIDIDKYNNDREFAIQEVESEESLKNRSWFKASGNKLMAGIASLDASVLSLLSMAAKAYPYQLPDEPNIVQKFADNWTEYFDKAKEHFQQKAQKHYGDIDGYINNKDYLSAAGATAANVIEAIPIVASFVAGNKAGALNEVAVLLGAAEGKRKYEEIKEIDIPESAKIVNSIETGLNFYLLSKVGGQTIANNVKSMVSTVGAEETKDVLGRMFKTFGENSIKTMYKGTSGALEGYSYGWFSSLANNLVDISTGVDPNRDPMQGNNESGLTWAMMHKLSTLRKDVQSLEKDIRMAMVKLPKNMPPEDIARSLDIIMEKDNLTKQNEVLDDLFQSVNKKRIDELKDKIVFITQSRINKEKIGALNSFVEGELAKDKPNIDKITEVSGELKNIEKVKLPEVEILDKKIDQLIKERDGIKLENLEGKEKSEGKAQVDKINTEIVDILNQKQALKKEFYDETIKGLNDPLDQQLYIKEKQQAIDELKQKLPNINLKQIKNEKIRKEEGERLLESEVTKLEETPPVTSEPKTSVVDDYKLSGIKKDLFEGQWENEKLTEKEWMNKGKELVDSGKLKPRELIEDINKNPRALNPEEVSSFIYYKAKLDNKYDELYDRIEKSKNEGNIEDEYNARVEFEGLQSELDNYRKMAVETAYLQGLSFRLRQGLLDSEYNLQSQIRKYKEVNNGEISPEVEAKFKEYSSKIDELNKKLRDKDAEIEKIRGSETISNIKSGAKRTSKERPGKELIAEGTSELAQALGVIQMAVGETRPEVSKALMKIGEGLIKEGIATIDNVIEKIKVYIDENFKGKLKLDDYIPELEDGLIVRPKAIEGRVDVPPRLIRNLVESGVEDIETLTGRIHKMLNDPNVSERQVRDAITKYGREISMTKDEVQAKINEMNRIGRYISKLEDLENKKVKLKESLTKKETLREKDLKTKIKKAIKDLGLVPSKMEITEHKVDIPESIKDLQKYKQTLNKSIEKYKDKLANKDFFPAKKKKIIEPDWEISQLQIELNKVREKYDLEYEKAKLANRRLEEITRNLFVDIMNIPKTLLSGADFSAVLRQGIILGFGNLEKVPAAIGEMFKQAFSSEKAERWMYELKANPEYQFMRQSGLYLSELKAKALAREEGFVSEIAKKIPVWGETIRTKGGKIVIPGLGIPSIGARAFNGYLNKLRVDVFNKGTKYLEDIGGYNKTRDPEVFKSWAKFINNATGRGNLGWAEPVADVLNLFMFSPRLVASRFNLLNPITYKKMPPAVRKMALKNMLSYIGMSSLILTIAGAAGADIELDPRSSDFGKIKVGDIRYDLWAGYQQWVRTLTQLISGQRKRTSGEIITLDPDKFPYETRLGLIGRFLRSKASPAVSLGIDILGGKTYEGEDITLKGEAINEAIPLYLQDMWDIYKEEGLSQTLGAILPGMFGVGVQYYDTKKRQKEGYEKEIQRWRKDNDPNNLFDRNYIAAYKDLMHKVNKIDQDKKFNELIDSEDTEAITKYLESKNVKKDYIFLLNNGANIDKMSRAITYFKSLPKEDQEFYVNEIQLAIDDMKFAYDNDDTFELNKDIEDLYKLYQNRNELRRKTKEELKKEL